MPITPEEWKTLGAATGVVMTLTIFLRWVIGYEWRQRAQIAEAQTDIAQARAENLQLKLEWQECRKEHSKTTADLWEVLNEVRDGVAEIRGYQKAQNKLHSE